MRLSPIVLIAAAVLFSGCGGPRQPPPWMRSAEKPRDENYNGGPSAMLTKHDANHDGILTRAELIAGLKAEFAAHDISHSGCLDDDQVSDLNQGRVDADQSSATPLMDWNRDGCMDYTEFSAAPYSLFDQLDRDRDGKLTPKELGIRNVAKPDQKPDSEASPDNGQSGPGPQQGRQRPSP